MYSFYFPVSEIYDYIESKSILALHIIFHTNNTVFVTHTRLLSVVWIDIECDTAFSYLCDMLSSLPGC